MKKKLSKRLTTIVVAVAMVATMVMGFSTDVKAGGPTSEELTLCDKIDSVSEELMGYYSGTEMSFKEFIPMILRDHPVYTFTDFIRYIYDTELENITFDAVGNKWYRGSYADYFKVVFENGQIKSLVYDSGLVFSREVPTPCEPQKYEEKPVEKVNPAFTHPDREKLKSTLPSMSVVASNGASYDDLKVFTANDTTKANQALLVNTFAQTAGKKARIILTDSLYTSRMLGADNGKTRTLKWANLEKTPQIVYACCYNQTDKVYFIQGILNKDGTATFNDFILRGMTNITIFVLE